MLLLETVYKEILISHISKISDICMYYSLYNVYVIFSFLIKLFQKRSYDTDNESEDRELDSRERERNLDV